MKQLDSSAALPQRRPDRGGVAEELWRYGKIIRALFKRELLSRRASPMYAILVMLEPVILIVIMTGAFWFLERQRAVIVGGSPILFFATGLYAKYLFIFISRRMRGMVDGVRGRFPIETRLDHVLVHMTVCILDYLILAIVLFGAIYIFFDHNSYPKDMIALVKAYVAIACIGFGVGIVNLVMGRRFKFWRFFFPPFMRLSIILSGAMFVVDFLPPTARYILSFNPIVHAIILFREGFYYDYPHLTLDQSYMWTCAVVAVLAGLVIERTTRRSET